MVKKKVYVEENCPSYVSMFVENGYEVVNELKDADILCLIGGSDVNPERYGHKCHHTTSFDPEWDDKTLGLYKYAEALGLFIVGICRGGQFINIQNGGVMYQHVDNHCISHEATNLVTGEKLHVSSTHHQMMYPPKHGQVVMEGTPQNTRGIIYAPEVGGFVTIEIDQDVEAVWFEDTNCFAFQPHPEYKGYEDCCRVFFEMLEDFMS